MAGGDRIEGGGRWGLLCKWRQNLKNHVLWVGMWKSALQCCRMWLYVEVGLLRLESVKIKSDWIRMGSWLSMSDTLIKTTAWRQRHCKNSTWWQGIGWIHPQAKDHPRLLRNHQKLGRGKGVSPRVSKVAWPLGKCLGFRHLASRTVRK